VATLTISDNDLSAAINAFAIAARENESEGLWESAVTQYRLASQGYGALGLHGMAARYARNAMALQDKIEAAARVRNSATCCDVMA
jgi:hypothetical protein